ncbi:hypothetical protein P168DRAFT_292923 [Aspergillus campestris IBT 28561]|uniref:Non-haem dioxygenase N-terminal domain-containing protein n=1 Tax=Aspergillus campestris (strain IBT 28561) TaxID=1392248 RepID=A0A2I1CTQ3_ASPC2|nr:uncharacterized protein P168DRAFT_292923 [Aspergillus campestris IBT 28561]PKY01013.1 hypothetical protein P168DRAFT_292923 [Aspergillus campestris IBT 28561]
MVTVDYSKLIGSHAEQKEALERLDPGLQTYGFVYVVNHGIPKHIIEDTFICFFTLNPPIKIMTAYSPSNAVKDHIPNMTR